MPLPLKNRPAARTEFIFVGEHPAVDFANTRVVSHGNPEELFLTWGDVVNWLLGAKLITREELESQPSAGVRAVEKVVELRDAWQRVLLELISGGSVDEAFLERLNVLLAPNTFHEFLHRDGKKGFRLVRSMTLLRGEKLVLCLIARQIATFLAEADLRYLHRCANTVSCVLFFYDTTKNHRRQWCSVATCGNRHKVAQFRKRQRRNGE